VVPLVPSPYAHTPRNTPTLQTSASSYSQPTHILPGNNPETVDESAFNSRFQLAPAPLTFGLKSMGAGGDLFHPSPILDQSPTLYSYPVYQDFPIPSQTFPPPTPLWPYEAYQSERSIFNTDNSRLELRSYARYFE